MRILFWGTPSFAVPSLAAVLRSGHTLAGLVTQPDRPRGRSGRPEAPPTKELVLRAAPRVPILQPLKPTGAAFRARLAELDADVSVVAAYGNLLPGRVLELPRLGSLNVHASLLPRHRGAAPVAAALLAGDRVTGITLMRMDRGLDTGPILHQRPLEIRPDESCGQLTERLAQLGADVVTEGLQLLEAGRLRATPQREEEATYAPRVTPEQARVRWDQPAAAIERALRAFDPWPGAFAAWDGRRLKLFRSRVAGLEESAAAADLARAAPGTLAAGERPRPGAPPAPALYVKTGDGVLEILELQLEGRPRMAAAEFLKGHKFPAGARLE
jgi:methionyl-tRNA formyltransferase